MERAIKRWSNLPLFGFLLYGCTLAGTVTASADMYAIKQGDVIEITVAGLPELRNRSNVQPDGAISFPLLGALKVEGLTPSELRLEIQKHLGGKIYRYHASDGRDVLTVIEADEVSAEIVGYRSIYVSGDVAHSGEQAFRPEMTVRQALALAGGVGAAPSRAHAYARDYLVVKSELGATQLSGASAAIHEARLSAQLKLTSAFPPVDLTEYDLPEEVRDALIAKETEVLGASIVDYQREDEFLKSAVVQAAERIDVVEKQRNQEEEGSQADSLELQRTIELLSRGQGTNPRVTDARRALLISSTRTLQVNVQLLELRRQKAESERAIQRFELERRLSWLKELEDATALKLTSAAKVKALQAELSVASRSGTADESKDPVQISFQVFRQNGSLTEKSMVDTDFRLVPGDTIEVTISRPQSTADAPAIVETSSSAATVLSADPR